jgi:hypothetical protein
MNGEDSMKPEDKKPSKPDPAGPARGARKPYAKPVLVRYGDVKDLTQGVGNTMNEGQPGGMMN